MKKKENIFSSLKFDLAAGLVVFFVALPLCLGISLASTSYQEMGDIAAFGGIVFPGLISGIVGGIIVGSISGAKFGVSGPAAGLITIVAAAIVGFGGFENGGYEKFILAVALAGVFQIILGFLKAGFVAYFIPSSVIKGMLAGIGITIIMKEIPHFFGYDKDPEGDIVFSQVDGHNTFSELYYMLDNVHLGATIIAIISMVLLIVWGMKFVKSNKILNLIPGPLVAILISVAVTFAIAGIPSLVVGGEHLVQVPTPDKLEDYKNLIYFPDFSALKDIKVYLVGFTIAIVASLESLLCVEATDKMDPNKSRTPLNLELKAQGVGNLVSGLLGGLPITQVIVRSSANINAGAKSKKSAIIHGLFLLLFVIAIPGLLNMIPRATLAAILILIGFKLASPKSIITIVKSGWTQYLPFVVVVVVMLLTDLLMGVGVGLGLAFLIILYRNFKLSYFKIPDTGDGVIHLELSQHATFLNKAVIVKTLEDIEDGKTVVIDLTLCHDIDYDIVEVINDFKESVVDRKIDLSIIDADKLSLAPDTRNTK